MSSDQLTLCIHSAQRWRNPHHNSRAWRTRLQYHLRSGSRNPGVRPDFKALSYAWGDPHETTKIMVSNRAFASTINLELALQHLRFEDRPRRLWVDAICINQDDKEERTAQALVCARRATVISGKFILDQDDIENILCTLASVHAASETQGIISNILLEKAIKLGVLRHKASLFEGLPPSLSLMEVFSLTEGRVCSFA
jgi:Heterokaryon incompatibility protein (HET)